MRSWAAIALISMGCVGTDVGNPPDDRRIAATLELAAVPEDVVGASALTTADGTEVAEAWLSIGSVQVRRAADDCPGMSSNETIEGPFFVELVSGDMIPAPIPLTDEVGTICALRLELAPAPEDAPANLAGRSAAVTGSADDGSSRSLSSGTRRTLPYLGDGFAIERDGRYIGAFDPANWFSGFDDSMPEATDESPAQINAFFDALRQDSRVVEDADDSGDVSPSEFRAPVALPE